MLKFLTAVSAAALVASAAGAQATTDAPSWTGPYAGIHGGYGFDGGQTIRNSGSTANNIFALNNGIRPTDLNQGRSGPLGGGQIGYNIQRGKLILGAEGDFSWMDSKGETTFRSPDAIATFPAGRRTYVKSDLDWMGTARGRLGYALGDSGMIYATGGYAFGKVKGSAEFDGDTDATVNYAGSHKYTAQGWTAGGGLEFRPFAHQGGSLARVSLRLEGLYYDLGHSNIYALQQNAATPGFYTLGVTTKGYNGRVGINYAF